MSEDWQVYNVALCGKKTVSERLTLQLRNEGGAKNFNARHCTGVYLKSYYIAGAAGTMPNVLWLVASGGLGKREQSLVQYTNAGAATQNCELSSRAIPLYTPGGYQSLTRHAT